MINVWEGPEKVIKKGWESDKNVMRKSWENVTRKSW